MNTLNEEDYKFYDKYKDNTSQIDKTVYFTNEGLVYNKSELKDTTHLKINDSINDEIIDIYYTPDVKYLDFTDFNYHSGGKVINFSFFEKLKILLIPFSYMFYPLSPYPKNLETLIIKLPTDLLFRLKYGINNVKIFELPNLPINLKKIVFLINNDIDEIYILNLKKNIYNDLLSCKLLDDCKIYLNDNLIFI
jgi:hypothetical protein